MSVAGPMLGSKELFIQEHERLVDARMEETGCDWSEAYEATSEFAWDAMRDRSAEMIDEAMIRRDMAND